MLTAIVTTAVPISAAQRQKLVKSLEKKFSGQEIKLEEIVNESIVGGLKLTVGSREIDASIASQLTQLKEQLLSHV